MLLRGKMGGSRISLQDFIGKNTQICLWVTHFFSWEVEISCIHSWNYTFPNWVYVVLPRVLALDGLFLSQKIDKNQPFTCNVDSLQEEEWLAQLETDFIEQIIFSHWATN